VNIALHGWPGIAGYALVCLGGGWLISIAHEWVTDRFKRDGWRVHRRWDRPRAWVLLPDGREARVAGVFRDWSDDPMAVVVPYADGVPMGSVWIIAEVLQPRPTVTS